MTKANNLFIKHNLLIAINKYILVHEPILNKTGFNFKNFITAENINALISRVSTVLWALRISGYSLPNVLTLDRFPFCVASSLAFDWSSAVC